MLLFTKVANHQRRGLALATTALIICSMSTGLLQWRIWCLKETIISHSSMAFIGMRRASFCQHSNHPSHLRICHHYIYHDNLVPSDIRIAQHLFLVASIIGLFGTACSAIALKHIHVQKSQKKDNFNPFFLSAVLNVAASGFIFLAIVCSYLSVSSREGAVFLPSLQMPLSPYAQGVGSAMAMASISAILFLLSAIFFISYYPPSEREMISNV